MAADGLLRELAQLAVEFDGRVFGGAVRSLYSGEQINDIDILVPDGRFLQALLERLGLRVKEAEEQEEWDVTKLFVDGVPIDVVECEFEGEVCFGGVADLDVNTLWITGIKESEVGEPEECFEIQSWYCLKDEEGRWMSGMENYDPVGHARRKEFVPLYDEDMDPEDLGIVAARAQRMVTRG
jgi:hypothetical protein